MFRTRSLPPVSENDLRYLAFIAASRVGRAEAVVAPGVAASPAEIDTNDFAAALARPESQRLFRIVDNEEALEEMLDAPLDQWRIFLHPSQSKLVRMQAKGPVRGLGKRRYWEDRRPDASSKVPSVERLYGCH